MVDWKKSLEHKKTIKINVLITAPDHKGKTMNETQKSLWAAEDEIKKKLEEINEQYKHLTFELEGREKLGYPKKKRMMKNRR